VNTINNESLRIAAALEAELKRTRRFGISQPELDALLPGDEGCYTASQGYAAGIHAAQHIARQVPSGQDMT